MDNRPDADGPAEKEKQQKDTAERDDLAYAAPESILFGGPAEEVLDRQENEDDDESGDSADDSTDQDPEEDDKQGARGNSFLLFSIGSSE